MTRRELLRALPAGPGLLAPLFDAQTCAASGLIGYRDYSRCVPDFMRSLSSDAYQRRDFAMQKLTTPEAIRSRQKWARAIFWKVIGGVPERTSLNAKVTARFRRAGYRVENLVYESRPGSWISANLYIPEHGTSPFPGVLFQMGHSPNGKAADSYQRCCQGLVKSGFVVLAFDPMGQGERINYPDNRRGLTRLGSADAEHTFPGRQVLLVGDTVTRMLLWDAVRSLDVLAGIPHVDPHRLACAGQSGGGTLTMMLAAVDDRIAAAVVSSGNTENVACAHFHPPGSVDDAEQNLMGAGPLGFDRWDLLWPFAPKPLLILTSAKDSFGTYSPEYEQSGLEEYARLQRTYKILGKPECLDRIESPLPHGLSYSMRLELCRWLTQWLQPGTELPSDEPPGHPEPDRRLWATSSGSVNRDLQSQSPFALLRRRATLIVTPAGVPDLRGLLRLGPKPVRATVNILGRTPLRLGEVVAAEVATAPYVWVPLWIFQPRKPVEQVLVIVDPDGRNAQSKEGGLYEQLMENTLVCAPDLRCMGDLRPEFSAGSPDYAREHESEENYAWASLIFGVSLLSQRVQDLAGVIEAIHGYFGEAKRLALAARGLSTVPTLCAGLLQPKVAALYLAGHLVSWRSITQEENYSAPFANFIPNILEQTDLPAIARGILPRKIVLAGVVDAAGRSLPITTARDVYPDPGIEIRLQQKWDAGTLSRV